MAPPSGPVDRAHETAALLRRYPNAYVRPLRPISPPSRSLPILGPRGLRRLDGPDRTGPERLKGFLKTYPSERMMAYPVGTTVNNPKNDEPKLIARAETA